MKKYFLFLAVCICVNFVNAQDSYYNTDYKLKMKALLPLVGNWEGKGWIKNKETGEKEFFLQKEEISYSLDSTIVIIDGQGKESGRVVHDAHAVVSVNPEGNFFFTSYLGDGRTGKYDFVVEGGKMIWQIPSPGGTVRFTITIEQGVWTEVGEFVTTANQVYPFMKMGLKKLD